MGEEKSGPELTLPAKISFVWPKQKSEEWWHIMVSWPREENKEHRDKPEVLWICSAHWDAFLFSFGKIPQDMIKAYFFSLDDLLLELMLAKWVILQVLEKQELYTYTPVMQIPHSLTVHII